MIRTNDPTRTVAAASAARAALAETQTLHVGAAETAVYAATMRQTPENVAHVAEALRDLHRARASLRRAGSHKAADYVSRAIKSAEGAYRFVSKGYSPRVQP